MEKGTIGLVFLLVAVSVAGCLQDANDASEDDAPAVPFVDAFGRTVTEIDLGDATAVVSAAMGAISEVKAEGGDLMVGLPPNVWVLQDGRLVWDMAGVFAVPSGDSLEFLVPTAAESIELALAQDGLGTGGGRGSGLPTAGSSDHWDAIGAAPEDVHTIPTPWQPDAPFANGDHVVELMEIQRERFPHRTPGMPNYEASQDYFVEYFRDLGYEIVVKDPFGTNDLPQPDGLPLNAKPASLANVYAYRPGTSTPDRIVGFGGHYDMVPNTKEAAFDDTTGTLMTLAMAKAFADIETDVGLLFGLWGGEENGLLGSNFFVKTNPDMVAQMVMYVNFDVAALAWPGPALDPDPILISPGPDGPPADALMAQAQRLVATYLPEIPVEKQIYEPIGEGQATGQGGVNAQSDHTAFMAQGVPVYFPFTGNVSNVFGIIHSERDTLHNLTVFMATQTPIAEGQGDVELTADEAETGRRLLARSMETFMGFALYTTLEIDQGLYTPPAGGSVPRP